MGSQVGDGVEFRGDGAAGIRRRGASALSVRGAVLPRPITWKSRLSSNCLFGGVEAHAVERVAFETTDAFAVGGPLVNIKGARGAA
jgi:hypothetical protein